MVKHWTYYRWAEVDYDGMISIRLAEHCLKLAGYNLPPIRELLR